MRTRRHQYLRAGLLIFGLALVPGACTQSGGTSDAPGVYPGARHREPMDFTGAGWEYRWGAAPEDARERHAWLTSTRSGDWKALPVGEQPPDRRGRRLLWQRVQLPDTAYRDTALYIYSIDTIFEAYLNETPIYKHGDFQRPKFAGWPFHLISLPADHAGRFLFLRIYSDYREIGIYGSLRLGERADLIQELFLADLDRVALSLLFFCAGLFAALFVVRARGSWIYLAFTLLCFATCFRVIEHTQIKQLLLDAPLFWIQAAFVALQVMLAAVVLFFAELHSGRERRLLLFLLAVQIPLGTALIVYGAFDILGAIALPVSVFTTLLFTGTILVLEFRRALRREKEAWLVFGGWTLGLLFVLHDIGRDYGYLPQHRPLDHWGILIFVAALGLVVVGRFAEVQRETVRLSALEKELQTARRLHSSLLPDELPGLVDLDVGVLYIPQAAMGGDFYDFHVVDGQRVGALIADVSGHGLSAALIVSMLKVAFSQHRDLADQPTELLRSMNETLWGKLGNNFITAAYAHLDLETRQVRYALAGHPPLLLLRGERVLELKAQGPPIGLRADARYDTGQVSLQTGDRLFLYTDGITECRSVANQYYEEARMMDALRQCAHLSADGLVHFLADDLARWNRPGRAFEDDIALVALGVA